MGYEFLNKLLSDKKGGGIFTCFGGWHIVYILLTVAGVFAFFFILKNKNKTIKDNAVKRFIDIAFGIFIADFFLMPFAYGEIDIEKLPFHICTATCVLCFLSWRINALEKYRVHIALLAFISNFGYLIYPAGVMWHSVHPLSYRVIETMTFHSVMSIYGLLVIIFNKNCLKFKNCYRDLVLLVIITAWAVIGNALYNGEYGSYNKFFNWFFVVRDPFYILPQNLSPYIMPILNITMFFAVEMIIYLLVYFVTKSKQNSNINQNLCE